MENTQMSKTNNELLLSARYIHTGNSGITLSIDRDVRRPDRAILNIVSGSMGAFHNETNIRGNDTRGLTSTQLWDLALMFVAAAQSLDDGRIPLHKWGKTPPIIKDDGEYWNFADLPPEINLAFGGLCGSLTRSESELLGPSFEDDALVIGSKAGVPATNLSACEPENEDSVLLNNFRLMMYKKLGILASKTMLGRHLAWCGDLIQKKLEQNYSEQSSIKKEILEDDLVTSVLDLLDLHKQKGNEWSLTGNDQLDNFILRWCVRPEAKSYRVKGRIRSVRRPGAENVFIDECEWPDTEVPSKRESLRIEALEKIANVVESIRQNAKVWQNSGSAPSYPNRTIHQVLVNGFERIEHILKSFEENTSEV